MTLLCRNERDILQPLLDFHLAYGVDHVIATDNASTDGSLDILRGYERRGVLTLLQEPSLTHDQAVWVTRMARRAARDHGADWVINTDADEFWWPVGGNLKEVLGNVPHDVAAASVRRFNFRMVQEVPELPFWRWMIYRERHSLNALGVPLPPKVCHRAYCDAEVADGNHSVLVNGRRIYAKDVTDIAIFHFPMRTATQFEAKIRLGAQALRLNCRISGHVGRTWRVLYEKYVEQGRMAEYVQQLSLDEKQVQAALDTGEIVLDERLATALEALYTSGKSGSTMT